MIARAALTAALCLFAASTAQAQSSHMGRRDRADTRACLIEAPLHGLGRPTLVTDCLQGAAQLRPAAIQQQCESLAWHAAAGMGRRNLTDLTWLPQCPRRDADALCKDAFGDGFDLYHYHRNDSQLDALADECQANGGQWRDLD